MSETGDFKQIKIGLKRIKDEIAEIERLALKKPVDELNFKAVLLMKALEAYMFDIENGMLYVAKSIIKNENKNAINRSVH